MDPSEPPDPERGAEPQVSPDWAESAVSSMTDEEAARLKALLFGTTDPRLTAVLLTQSRLDTNEKARLDAEAKRESAREGLAEAERAIVAAEAALHAAEGALRDAMGAASPEREALRAAEREIRRCRTEELRLLEGFKEMIGSRRGLQSVVDEATRIARLIGGGEIRVPEELAPPASEPRRTYSTQLTENRKKLLACFPRDRPVDLEELTQAYYGGDDSEMLRDNVRTVLKWLIKLGHVERAPTRGQYLRRAHDKKSPE